MKYAYFFLVTYFISMETIMAGALAPEINLEGRLLTNNDYKVVKLICSTNIAVQFCTVEFLIDKRTHDNIRYFDNNCYHTMWICSPTVCACSDDCMSFTLNVTVTHDMMNHSYSCASRIENEGVTYLANITVIHDGNGEFKLLKKIVVPYSSVSSTLKVTTFSPEISTVSFLSVPLVIAGAAFGFLSCILLVIILLMTCRRYCNSKTAKDWTPNNNDQCPQHNATVNGLGTHNHHILNKDDSTEINSNEQDVFKVQAEINSAGARLSVASSNQSDNRSVDLLIGNSNNTSVVKFHQDKLDSTYI